MTFLKPALRMKQSRLCFPSKGGSPLPPFRKGVLATLFFHTNLHSLQWPGPKLSILSHHFRSRNSANASQKFWNELERLQLNTEDLIFCRSLAPGGDVCDGCVDRAYLLRPSSNASCLFVPDSHGTLAQCWSYLVFPAKTYVLSSF